MNRLKLNPRWNRWQKIRRSELLEEGASRKIADLISNAEAAGRQRIDAIVGRSVAMAAELTIVKTLDGSEKIVMLIDPAMISAEEHELAYQKLGIRAKTVFAPCLFGASENEQE